MLKKSKVKAREISKKSEEAVKEYTLSDSGKEICYTDCPKCKGQNTLKMTWDTAIFSILGLDGKKSAVCESCGYEEP